MISIGALLHRRWRRLLRTFVIVLAAAVPAAGMLAALPPVVAFASPAIRCAPTVGASAGGGEHTLSVKSDGTARAWGNNWAGQLGDGGVEASSTTPKAVVGLTNVAAMAAGANHSLALTSDGTVWAWGYNADGELGDGTTLSRNTPEQVAGLHNVVAVAGGNGYSMAAEADATLWAWGYNGDGERHLGGWIRLHGGRQRRHPPGLGQQPRGRGWEPFGGELSQHPGSARKYRDGRGSRGRREPPDRRRHLGQRVDLGREPLWRARLRHLAGGELSRDAAGRSWR